MSIFSQLTIPKQTLVTNPTILEVPVYPGIIRKVQVLHPTGCVDLVGVWIEYLSAKIFPSNSDGYFIGNGFPINFSPDFPLDKSPFILLLKGYNEDTVYQHQITFLIELEGRGSFASKESAGKTLSPFVITATGES